VTPATGLVNGTATGTAAGRRWRRARGARANARSIAERALAAAPAGHVVLGPRGELLLCNESARRLGIVAGDIVDPRIVERATQSAQATAPAATQAATHAAPEQVWQSVGEPGRPEVLQLRAHPLGDGLTLITATDETAAHHTELVRRDFIANVSHELKSPVTALGLLAEAVTEAADSPDTVRGFAERMRRETSRLGTLITELIALSALQNGTLDEPVPVAVDDVIADGADRPAIAAAAKNIVIHVDNTTGAVVLGDRSLLTTALGNLVENAVNYSEPGSTVSVSSTLRRGHVHIAVSDRGIGIASKDQQRIFERFFRADPARSRATGGTGLGLAIVKHIATNHGGSIQVFSREGIGSTFTLRLPLAGPPARSTPPPPPEDR
jgi:two-component system sensor histidine kinase SenX3